ncbi:MAG: diadenylate cyclase CdaA [Ignavibacteria bacterium]
MIDILNLDFITITLLDLIDIFLVAYLFYIIYKNMRGTIASQIFLGLVILLLLSFTARALNLKLMGYLLKLVTDIWVIVFVILFQPELRRLLLLLSRYRIFGYYFQKETDKMIKEIVDTVFELSDKQWGALIVLSRTTGLRGVIETGISIGARLSKPLLISIFNPRSPLHDGAVVIRNNVLEAARCTLPLSSQNIIDGFQLGMRHKAGIGITEQADVISIIVSEESGSVSLAEDGKLYRGLSKLELTDKLNKMFSQKTLRGNLFKLKTLDKE